MGIYATEHPGNIIVSPDKDMRQIPGKLFDMKETVTIDPEEGRRWHLIQSLAGDQTDGYSGCPGIGIKRAVTLFEEGGYNWDVVVKAFADKDLGEDVALMNAQLAKILTNKDYDGQVIPWTPTTSN
jgi:DNA polymerase-1